MQKKTLAIVIPCYNEASRLPVRSYKSFLNKARDVSIFFINDGSIDETERLIQEMVVECIQNTINKKCFLHSSKYKPCVFNLLSLPSENIHCNMAVHIIPRKLPIVKPSTVKITIICPATGRSVDFVTDAGADIILDAGGEQVIFKDGSTNVGQADLSSDNFTFKSMVSDKDLIEEFDTIKEDWCFLFVGHWLQGNSESDRKDVGSLVRTFIESFKDKKNQPALILKTSGAGFGIIEKKQVLDKIKPERKDKIYKSANQFIEQNTTL